MSTSFFYLWTLYNQFLKSNQMELIRNTPPLMAPAVFRKTAKKTVNYWTIEAIVAKCEMYYGSSSRKTLHVSMEIDNKPIT